MKKLIAFVLVLFLGYAGVAYLMENLTFESLPGQIARASAYTLWNAVASGTTNTISLPMNEIQSAIDFNPKIRLVSFEGRAEPVPATRGEEILKANRNVFRQLWPTPIKKGETLGYFYARADFTVESTCIPFMHRRKGFRVEIVTSCPVQRPQ